MLFDLNDGVSVCSGPKGNIYFTLLSLPIFRGFFKFDGIMKHAQILENKQGYFICHNWVLPCGYCSSYIL